MEEKIADQTAIRKLCPSISKPFEDCYCTKEGSDHLGKMLQFCCNDFESCEILKSAMSEAKAAQRE